jgi:hypothetical protein
MYVCIYIHTYIHIYIYIHIWNKRIFAQPKTAHAIDKFTNQNTGNYRGVLCRSAEIKHTPAQLGTTYAIRTFINIRILSIGLQICRALEEVEKYKRMLAEQKATHAEQSDVSRKQLDKVLPAYIDTYTHTCIHAYIHTYKHTLQLVKQRILQFPYYLLLFFFFMWVYCAYVPLRLPYAWVCAYVSVYMFAYVHTHTDIFTDARTESYVNLRAYISYAYKYMCTHAYCRIGIHICMHTYKSANSHHRLWQKRRNSSNKRTSSLTVSRNKWS